MTPVKPDIFETYLRETNYDEAETEFLVNGFRQGFDICYEGPSIRQSNSRNIPIRVGSKTELWNKIMKEVEQKRVAGPYDKVPFENYIQSPVGLVPKAGEGKTRLIFHLSYDFSEQEKSVNHHTPKAKCSVKYNDLDHAMQQILELRNQALLINSDENPVVYTSKTDAQSAFRLVPLLKRCWPWLIMMAENPRTKKMQYFVDKCLPFGASISCAHFQRISNGISHIMRVRTKANFTNYLDDFLFLALTICCCNALLSQFLQLCSHIGFPMSMDKTQWATDMITFLGLLLSGRLFTVGIPLEKRNKAEHLLRSMLSKSKATVKDLQALCGYLNFLGRAIYPGRAFTRRMYAKFSAIVDVKSTGNSVTCRFVPKKYHHIRLDKEFKMDCQIWLEFITNDNLRAIVNRPMIDYSVCTTAEDIGFYSDASTAESLGFGCVLGKQWIFGQWEPGFIKTKKPSIEFLKLYALVAGLLT